MKRFISLGTLAVLLGLVAPAGVTAATGGAVSGTVTDAGSGLPLQGVEVCALTGFFEYKGCDASDSAGGYEIPELSAGPYKVQFNAYDPPYLQQYFDGVGSIGAATSVTVAAGGKATGIDAAMEAGGSISGQVREAGGGSLEGMSVCAEGVESGYGRCDTTDESGAYEVTTLPSGTYKVRFEGGYGEVEGEYTLLNYITQYFDGKISWSAADEIEIGSGTHVDGIDAELEEGGEIAGTVTAAAGGAAIQSIEVCAYPLATSNALECETTDSDGEYSVRGLPIGNYRVGFRPGFSSGNFARQYYNGKTTLAGADPVAVSAGVRTEDVDAALVEAGKISGTVTSAQGGAGLGSVQVCASPSNWEGGSYRCAQTAAGGAYTITGLQNDEYTVEFSGGTNYVTQYYSGKATFSDANKVQASEGTTKSGIDAALQPAGRIEGKVTATDLGGPLQGAEVCAAKAGAEYFLSVRCGSAAADGSYTIGGLAAGSYAVRFAGGYGGGSSSNYLTQFYDDHPSYPEADPVAVSVGTATTDIDAELRPGAKITGTVVDAVSKAGLPASVCASRTGRGGEGSFCVTANQDGSYSIQGLRGGTYKVRFGPGYQSLNYLRQWYSGKPTSREANPVTVLEGETSEDIDAELARGGKITGTVTDAVTHSPLAGIDVCAARFGHCDETGDDGKYVVEGLATGSFKLIFRDSNEAPEYAQVYYHDKATSDEAQSIAVTAGQTTPGVDQQMREGGRISGTVLDADSGDPLQGMDVCAWSPTVEFSRCASTDSAGEYVIAALPASSYQVRFDPPYIGMDASKQNYVRQFYDEVESADAATLVPVTLGGEADGIDAAMYEGGKIDGLVTAAVGGTPVKGAAACAYPLSEPEEFENCAATDANGEYTLEGLGAGSYRVAFYPNYFGGSNSNLMYQYYDEVADWDDADPVAVGLGATTHGIDAALLAGARITGIVLDGADDSPLQGIQVCAYETGGGSEPSGCSSTNAQGKYTITSLPAGSYKIGFTAFVYEYEEGPFEEGGGEEPPAEEEYVTQYYSGKSSLATANQVTLATGGTATAVDAKMVKASGPPAKPASLTPPKLTGEPLVGKTLSCSQGTWSGSPTSFTYRWLRDGTTIPARVANTYLVETDDQGHDLSCEVAAGNAGGLAKASSNVVEVPDEGEEVVQRTLGVARVGSGNGTVTSTPAGIACGATCSHAFADGTAVTLSAAAAAGSTFVGWSGGGCSGTGQCQIDLGAETTVSANFALEPGDGDGEGGDGDGGGGGGGAQAVVGTTAPPTAPVKPKALKCRKGMKKKVVRGKRKCVKARKARGHRR